MAMSKGFASNYRIVLLASLVVLSFAGIGSRLVFLHVIDRGPLLGMIEQARRELIPDYARRGDILDVKNNVLATSHSIIVLGADPQSIRPEDRKKWPELARLVGMPLGQIEQILTTKFRTAAPSANAGAPAAGLVLNFKFSSPAPAPADSDDEATVGEAGPDGRKPIEWVKLSDDLSESTYADIQKLGVRGVYGNRVFRRVYPHNELAAHIVGFVNRYELPVAGIENYANFYLRGQNGWVESEKDGHQRELAQFRTREVPAADGDSVVLSIDSNVQHIAESEIEFIAKKFQPQKITIIVSDPRTGFILALANYPGFNLNSPNKLTKDEMGRMTNIALADIYEPGSVFKIVAASGAINDGLVTPGARFDCTLEKIDYEGRTCNLPREDVSDHFEHPLTVAEIIAKSSNKGAAQLAMRLGDRRFYDYVRAFGFGQKTGFPNLGDESRGLLEPPEKWDGLTITRMPMGQSVGATPLQMHQAMSVIASGGLLLRPQVIKQIRDSTGEIVYRFDGAQTRRVVSERTAATMAKLLQAVASDQGTAPQAAIAGYEVAGKTGTAQKVEPVALASGKVVMRYADHHHVASFVGFFPASHPQVSISVIVDDADERLMGGTAYGNRVAAPSFKHIGEQLIGYLDIRPPAADSGRSAVAWEGGRR